MRSPSSAHTLVAGAVSLAALAAAWFFFAPAVFGGSTSYVTTEGVSMLPHFHTGDLVLVRAQGDYRVGEIVAYRSSMLHTIVLHRIIGRNGSRYVFKGDNNSWIDPEHPTGDQLVGRLWIHLPGVAGNLASLRRPPVIAAQIGFGVLLLLGGAFTKQRRRRRRDPEQPPRRPQPTADWTMALLTVGAFVLSPLTALAVVAYAKPVLTPGPVTAPYAQHGQLSYSATTVPGAVYPDGRASTGEPLYLKLVRTLDIRYAYRFHAAAGHSVHGVTSLDARISSGTGWKQTIHLQGPRRFTGDRATLSGTLDLAMLPSLMHTLDTATAVTGTYTLELVPHVRVNGAVGGFPLRATFGTPIPFSLNNLEIQPIGAGSDGIPQLGQSASGSTHGTKLQPAVLQFKVAHLDVATARTIASRGLVTAICALLGCALAFRLARRELPSATAAIEARYRRFMVPVSNVLQAAPNQLVQMGDMAALARLAERYDRMILHESTPAGDTFSVAEDGVLYQYAVPAPAQEQQAQRPKPQAGPVVVHAPLTAAPALRDLPQPQKRTA